jgi:predicted P-loop ATPase
MSQGKLILECSELVGLQSAKGFAAVKAQITRRADVSRLSYGHYTSDVPRQFVFIGTTNATKWLPPDEGGLRRFWPVSVTRMMTADEEAELKELRDQLWGEAAAMESAGLSHNIPQELWTAEEAERKERLQHDSAEDLIAQWLDEEQPVLVTPTMLAKKFSEWRQDLQRAQNRRVVRRAMEANGYRVRHTNAGNVYDRVGSPETASGQSRSSSPAVSEVVVPFRAFLREGNRFVLNPQGIFNLKRYLARERAERRRQRKLKT